MTDGESILVVEDCAEIQEVLKLLLELEGYRPIIAGTGAEALQILQGGSLFSLVLLDISLPDMRAFEFLDKLDQAKIKTSLPIVLCSAASDLQEMKLPARVVGVLPKPFKIEELFAVISAFKANSNLNNAGLRVNLSKNIAGDSRHVI